MSKRFADIQRVEDLGPIGDHRMIYQSRIRYTGPELLGEWIADLIDDYIEQLLGNEILEEIWDRIWQNNPSTEQRFHDLAQDVDDSFTRLVVESSTAAANTLGERLQGG